MLDLWQNDTNVIAAPQPGEAKDLPATFGDTFEAAWNAGRLFSQSVAGDNARMAALQDHIDDIKDKTGKDLNSSIDFSGFNDPGVGFIPPTASMLLPQVNEEAKKLGQPELSDDDLEQAAIKKSRDAVGGDGAMAGREQTFGGRVGSFLG